MRIDRMYIEGIQSIKKPIWLNFDKHVTRIGGRNTSGKSAIRKSLSLFAGVYTRDQILGLVSWDRPIGKDSVVGLILEDSTALWATIANTSKVQYQYRDNNGEVLKVWEAWDKEIIDILGWQTVEKERLCLNIKKSKVNLFIDTSPRTNGEITDYLCSDKNMEIRIANLEDLEIKLKESAQVTKLKVSEYGRKYNNIVDINIDSIKSTYERIASIEVANGIHNNLTIYHKSKELGMKYRDLERVEICLKLLEYIRLIKCKIEINKKLHALQIITEYLGVQEYTNLRLVEHKMRDKHNLVNDLMVMVISKNNMDNITNYNILQQTKDMKNTLSNNLTNFNMLLNDVLSIQQLKIMSALKFKIRNSNEGINSNNAITTLLEKLNKTNDMKSTVEGMGITRDKYSKTEELNIILNNSRVLSEMKEISKLKKGLYEHTEIIDMLYELIEENNICPLCSSEIDVDKLRGEEHCHNL